MVEKVTKLGLVSIVQDIKIGLLTGSRLQPEWLGPYKILNVGENNICKIEKDGLELKQTINVSQLKPFLQRSISTCCNRQLLKYYIHILVL